MRDRESPSIRPPVTTTHAGWGEGHPRLIVSNRDDRFIHDISHDLTRIGSSDDNEIVLPDVDPLHATITHDATDEYVLILFGRGETTAAARKGPGMRGAPSEVLRTGAHFSAGPWLFVFTRDEFADHGRPYGGRQGGEGAHQRRQPPRPDYTLRYPLSRDQMILVDEVSRPSDPPALAFFVVKDESASSYTALAGESTIGELSYSVAAEDRLTLAALFVEPEYRSQGIASDLIRRVLDDIRSQNRTVTVLCPIVRAFVDRNPEYGDLVDPDQPGILSAAETL